jgi:hypothetical protein
MGSGFGGKKFFYFRTQIFSGEGFLQEWRTGCEFPVSTEMARAFLWDIQNGQLCISGRELPGYRDPVGCGEYRFYHEQINWAMMLFHKVIDIRRCAGFENSMPFQAQDLPENGPKRVVIIDQENRAHTASDAATPHQASGFVMWL